MKGVVVKLLVSISIGIIVGQIIGMSTKITKYYDLRDNPKREVTLEYYEARNRNKTLKIEESFNKSNFIYYGLISGASVFLLLLLPDLFFSIFKRPTLSKSQNLD